MAGSQDKGKAVDSTSSGPSTAHHPPPYEETEEPFGAPTISAPFNFPAEPERPPYYGSSTSGSTTCSTSTSASHQSIRRPIAIPQVKPDPGSPLVSAYAHSLLHHGITDKTWHSFLDTMSAFLTAKVSDRAISHAGDIAKQVVQGPQSLAQGIISHAKSVGKNIASDAKRGNIIGATMNAIGGAIGIPVHAAWGTVGTAVALPGSAIGAITKKPQTPLQRATAYAAVANDKWLRSRGLQAQFLDTTQLAELLGLSATALLEATKETKDSSASGQLKTLEGCIAGLVVQEKAALHLSTETLWLVLIQVVQGHISSQ